MYKRGSVWHAWNPKTKQRESTGRTDRRAAESVVADWQRAAADPTYQDASSKTLADLYRIVLDEKRRRGRAEGTIEMYDQKLRQWARVAESVGSRLGERTPVREIFQPDFIDAYETYRRAEGISVGTIHKEIVAIRQGAKLCARRGWLRGVEWRDALPVGASDGYVPQTAYLPIADWPKLIDVLPPARAAQVAWHLGTGANAAEARAARPEHLLDGLVKIPGTKTRFRDRTIPVLTLFTPYVELGASWLRARGEFAHWASEQRDMRRACRRAGVTECTSNRLRASFASALVQAGVPFDLAAKMLGHGSTKMLTLVYGQIPATHLASLIDPILRQWDTGVTAPRPYAASDASDD